MQFESVWLHEAEKIYITVTFFPRGQDKNIEPQDRENLYTKHFFLKNLLVKISFKW